jgi:Glycosyltransferase family 87
MSRSAWSPSAVELGALLLLLNGLLWGVAALNVATPGTRGRSGLVKGGDFVHFYTLGSLAAEGRFDLLYTEEAQHARQERLVPSSEGLWFAAANGPQVALLFAPLARLPYLRAVAAWTLLTVLLYGACLWIVWRDCPSLRGHKLLVILAACGFEPFWALIHHGQTSALPLLCFTGAWLAVKANRPWWIGFALGSLIIKPHLGAAVAVVMAARREWRIVGGAVVAVALQWGITVAAVGVTPFHEYLLVLLRGPWTSQLEPNPYAVHSLLGFWTLLCQQRATALALYLLTGVGVLMAAARLWRRSIPGGIRYSALLLATVLVSPHMRVYELVQLAPAFLLSFDASERLTAGPRRVLHLSLGLAYVLPLFGFLASPTRVQWSVPVLAGWLAALLWTGRRRASDVSGDCTNRGGSPGRRAAPAA